MIMLFTENTNAPLITIRHRYEEIGTLAAELLIEIMNGEPEEVCGLLRNFSDGIRLFV